MPCENHFSVRISEQFTERLLELVGSLQGGFHFSTKSPRVFSNIGEVSTHPRKYDRSESFQEATRLQLGAASASFSATRLRSFSKAARCLIEGSSCQTDICKSRLGNYSPLKFGLLCRRLGRRMRAFVE